MPGFLRAGPNALWTPSRQTKPVGAPRIDWSHPLTRGLISYWFDPGVGWPVDLVSGHTAVLDTGAAQPPVKATAYGQGLSYTVPTTAAAVHDPSFFPIQSWAHPYSCAVGFYQIGLANIGGYFGVCDAAGNDVFMFYNPVDAAFGLSIANSTTANNFTYVNNTFYVVVGATTGASAWSWWVNGAAQTNGSTTTTFNGSSMGVTIGNVNYNSIGAFLPNAAIFFGAIWNVQLSAENAKLLYNDPYCFLLPQEIMMPSLFVAAADVLSAQIWM